MNWKPVKIRKGLALFLVAVLMVSVLPWTGDTVSAAELSGVLQNMEDAEKSEEMTEETTESEEDAGEEEASESGETSETTEESETEETSEQVEDTGAGTEESQEETQASETAEGEGGKESTEASQESQAAETGEDVGDGEVVPYADIIASGQDNDITWVIDADGKLTISGTGDCSRGAGPSWRWWGWIEYSEQITSAEVNVTGMTNASSMFNGCNNLRSIDLSGFDTSSVTNMNAMFAYCSSLESIDLSGFDTSSVTNMSVMFTDCSSLESIDLSGFDTNNVTDMSFMFDGCSSLESIDLSGFDTSSVTDMYGMFENCSSLESIDLSGFDTSGVTNMWWVFKGCSSLGSLDLSSFDTSNVTNMDSMFENCSSLESIDLSDFDTSNVTGMGSMFEGCSSLGSLDLSNFDTSKVFFADSMLSGCSNLTKIQSPYNMSQQVPLPSVKGSTWRLPDGTEVTELPQGLDYSVVLTRYDNPQITTTTEDLNMEDVIRVKYVPYSYTVVTNNTDEENQVTFSLESGILPRGLEIYPATGEIYGMPLEAGEFPITVKASYSDPKYEPSYAQLTVIVKDNTDSNVYDASDSGYELLVPVGERAGEDSGEFVLRQKGDQLFVSAGEFGEFIALWLNGEQLQEGVDYTKESGSTRITIIAQTFENRASRSGANTLAMEFRTTENRELKRTAQNFRIEYQDEGSGKDGDGEGGGSQNEEEGSGSGDEGNDAGGASGSIATIAEVENQAETIIHTVVSGDSLWKIAKQYYGSGTYWQKIYADNAAIISDPDKIYVGQKLTIYLTKGNNTAAAAEISGNTYTVESGDTLWKIAQKIYGKGRYWKKIYNANTGIIADPERIYAGQVIVIPED